MLESRTDHERVIKLLMATLLDGDEPPVVWVDREDVTVAWTDRELAEADGYRLEVTVRPGGWGEPTGGWPDGPPPARFAPRPMLELRLRRDRSWEPYEATQEGP